MIYISNLVVKGFKNSIIASSIFRGRKTGNKLKWGLHNLKLRSVLKSPRLPRVIKPHRICIQWIGSLVDLRDEGGFIILEDVE